MTNGCPHEPLLTATGAIYTPFDPPRFPEFQITAGQGRRSEEFFAEFYRQSDAWDAINAHHRICVCMHCGSLVMLTLDHQEPST